MLLYKDRIKTFARGLFKIIFLRDFSKDDNATLGLRIKRELYWQEINILFSSPVDFLVTVIELHFFCYDNLLIFNYIARRVY